jgi:Asp-tRNA(Asn)/Glu-tRNA(Gln) amidotransferase C subunit
MTIQEARKILKVSKKEFSDEELKKVLHTIRQLAKLYLRT